MKHPGYFARVFKRHKAMTPQDFRAQLEAHRTQRELQPKTVYFDRLDYTHGAPPAAAASAANAAVSVGS